MIVILLTFILAECNWDNCYYTEFYSANCFVVNVILLNVILLSDIQMIVLNVMHLAWNQNCSPKIVQFLDVLGDKQK